MSVPWWVVPPTVWALALLAAPSWGQVSRRARGLDETQENEAAIPSLRAATVDGDLCLVEPTAPFTPPGGGLIAGAEPGHAPSLRGVLPRPPSVAAPAPSGASAPPHSTAPGRKTWRVVRGRGQRRTV